MEIKNGKAISEWVSDIFSLNYDSVKEKLLTPFGTMQIYVNGTRKENIIQMNVMPDGKLICPLEFEFFFKWFRNDKNIQVNQFWTKYLDKSIQYNCVTVMSMSEKDYENILQQAMKNTGGVL